jgi:Flp pilus assembly protein TadG
MSRRLQRTAAHGQRGLATVEMAIGLPVLLLLLFATAEFGRMLSQYDTLTKAVRNGARYAASVSSLGTTGLVYITPAIQTAVANLVVSGNVNGTGAPLLPGLTTAEVTVSAINPLYVEVSVSYPYEPMLGVALPAFGLGQPIPADPTLTATSVMRAL